tara:strand:- start:61 stop:408 length:348 start_codon:yes stop_codon:yes gene_type:complete
MANKKNPDGNQEPKIEPIWTNNKIASHAAELYDTYRKLFTEDNAKGIEAILHDFCVLQGKYHQLAEAYETNTQVSREAADVTHKAVQKYQEFESTLKSQGKSFSRRLENLEHHGF